MSKALHLATNLKKAASIIREGGDVDSDYFNNAEEFAQSIDKLIDAIIDGQKNPFKYLYALVLRKKAKYSWASPSFDLDDYLHHHPDALKLGNEIYGLL